MPSEPDNRKIEELLKAYGKKRQEELHAPLELHPATRKMLQGEVAKLRPATGPQKTGLLAIVNVNRHPNGPQELALNKNSKEDRLERRIDADKDSQEAPPVGTPRPAD